MLWTTFITFELYLTIAFGSVTHRNLFLEDPIKLPILNVELPLVGFFAVAPTILVIFHFYIFLQLVALARKVTDYDALLRQAIPLETDRQYLRQRLDSFLVLQFLAGPRAQRTGFTGFSLRSIGWLTLVGTPVLILFQGQMTFLPYHHEWVVWLQRVAIFLDLLMIWYFWGRLRNVDSPILGRALSPVWPIIGGLTSFSIVLFSISLATFPGERADKHIPALRVIPILAFRADPDEARSWRIARWTSLHKLLFGEMVDEVSGRSRSLFSNRLVLTDQSFVDLDKLDKLDVTRSFRGRDLREAVLNRVDLRKADFTGAILDGAQLDEAKLQNAQFGCARAGNGFGCTSLQDATLYRASLQGAMLNGAQLQGAALVEAQLQGASLRNARLNDAYLDRAVLSGADLEQANLSGAKLDSTELENAKLRDAKLRGAFLRRTKLRGVSLREAQLQGAYLIGTQLQGASLVAAELTGARLDHVELQAANLREARLEGAHLYDVQLEGASLDDAKLQGANLSGTNLKGASLVGAEVWRAHGVPELDLADLRHINLDEMRLRKRIGAPCG